MPSARRSRSRPSAPIRSARGRCVRRPARSSGSRSSTGTTRPLAASRSTPTAATPSPRSTSLLRSRSSWARNAKGSPNALVTQCHKATIPLPGEAESLNVAAAGAIALYELARRSPSPDALCQTLAVRAPAGRGLSARPRLELVACRHCAISRRLTASRRMDTLRRLVSLRADACRIRCLTRASSRTRRRLHRRLRRPRPRSRRRLRPSPSSGARARCRSRTRGRRSRCSTRPEPRSPPGEIQ